MLVLSRWRQAKEDDVVMVRSLFVVGPLRYEIVPKRDDYRDDSVVPAEPGWPVWSEDRQRRAHDRPQASWVNWSHTSHVRGVIALFRSSPGTRAVTWAR